jgi:hypothetical protein
MIQFNTLSYDIDFQIWDNIGYRILYYIKYILYPFFYGVMIDGTMKLTLPLFYKPEPWLEK